IWDATHPPEHTTIQWSEQNSNYFAAFSPDSRRIAGSLQANDGWTQIVLWDAVSGAEERRIGGAIRETIYQVAFSPDGQWVAGCAHLASAGHQVRIWDLKDGKLLRSLPSDGMIYPCLALAYSPNGKLVAAGGYDRTVHVWDLETGAEKFRFAGYA